MVQPLVRKNFSNSIISPILKILDNTPHISWLRDPTNLYVGLQVNQEESWIGYKQAK